MQSQMPQGADLAQVPTGGAVNSGTGHSTETPGLAGTPAAPPKASHSVPRSPHRLRPPIPPRLLLGQISLLCLQKPHSPLATPNLPSNSNSLIPRRPLMITASGDHGRQAADLASTVNGCPGAQGLRRSQAGAAHTPAPYQPLARPRPRPGPPSGSTVRSWPPAAPPAAGPPAAAAASGPPAPPPGPARWPPSGPAPPAGWPSPP